MKAGTHNHVKVKRLKRVLGIPLYQAVGILETLWLLCIDCCDEGNIGKFTDEEIADYLEWKGNPSELVQGLAAAGWTDQDEDDRPVIHDWMHHCPEYIKERVRKRHARAEKSNKQRTYDEDSRDKCGQERDMSHLCPGLSESVPSIPNPTQPNPTNSNPSPPPCGGREGEGVSWKLVSKELKASGVNDSASAVRDAKANGLAPQAVLDLVMHFRASPGAWEAGALHFRVRTGTPETPANKGWPPPAKDFTEKIKSNGEARRRDYSAKIDSLSEALLIEIMAKSANPLIRERFRIGGREDGVVRDFLADHLAKGPTA